MVSEANPSMYLVSCAHLAQRTVAMFFDN
jgi:hypothetical protein